MDNGRSELFSLFLCPPKMKKKISPELCSSLSVCLLAFESNPPKNNGVLIENVSRLIIKSLVQVSGHK